MATLSEALDIALNYHRSGDLSAAETIYRRILAVEPALVDAWYLLGVVCREQGRAEEAVDALREAVERSPSTARCRHQLGVALAGTGDLEGAVAALRMAVELEPDAAEFWADLGTALARNGALAEAEAAVERALALRPDDAGARRNLAALLVNQANALRQEGKDPVEAVARLQRAVTLDPDRADLHARLGSALFQGERLAEAVAAYEKALQLAPEDAESGINLGYALNRLGRFDEAETILRGALAKAPESMAAHVNLGNALHGQGRLEEAAECHRAALALDPASIPARVNLGTVHRDLGDDAASDAEYRAALVQDPENPEIHWQRALARLLAGDMETGWAEYEWRWRTGRLAPPVELAALPEWSGGDPAGCRLLLHAEQGHGDTLQFIRYAHRLRDRGAEIGLQVQPALVRLMRQSLDGVAVEAFGTVPKPGFWQARCPLLGLPLRMGTRLDSVPADIPYVRASADEVAAWRKRLAGMAGLKIGLVWAGDPRPDDPDAAIIDRRRSLSLAELAPLAAVPGVSFVSLQKGGAAGQVAAAPFPVLDVAEDLYDFAATAALISTLDLVIGVDTAAVHLAGALGRPVWVLSRWDGCWRWLRHRDDSPWYPTLRLFRQSRWGDWSGPLAAVAEALQDMAALRV